MIIKSAEGVRGKTPRRQADDSSTADAKLNSQQRLSTEDKSKGGKGEFPLDHILPVFNLNSKEKDNSFVPTLKFRSKDTANKARKGIIRGTTVPRKLPSQDVADNKGLSINRSNTQAVAGQGKNPAIGPGAGGLGLANPLNALKSPQVGSSFRERNLSHAPDLATGAELEQYARSPPPARFNSPMQLPNADMAILDSFTAKPMIEGRNSGMQASASVNDGQSDFRKHPPK